MCSLMVKPKRLMMDLVIQKRLVMVMLNQMDSLTHFHSLMDSEKLMGFERHWYLSLVIQTPMDLQKHLATERTMVTETVMLMLMVKPKHFVIQTPMDLWKLMGSENVKKKRLAKSKDLVTILRPLQIPKQHLSNLLH